MWPKIVQVNHSDVYVVGGNDTTPSTQYNLQQKTLNMCLKIDISKATVEMRAPLNIARQAHGICSIGNFIYVAGGIEATDNALDSCERFDILLNKWKILKNCKLPTQIFSLSLIPHS